MLKIPKNNLVMGFYDKKAHAQVKIGSHVELALVWNTVAAGILIIVAIANHHAQ